MRVLAIAAVALAAAGSGAMGQDLGPAASPDWSGFYAGIFAGYGLDAQSASSVSQTQVLAISGGTMTGEYELTRSQIATPLGGLQAGYDQQWDNLVLGGEIGLLLGDFSKEANTRLDVDADAGANSFESTGLATRSFASNAIGTLEGKLGFAFGNWLVYGKGGLAVTEATASSSTSLTASGPGALGISDLQLDKSNTAVLFGTTVSIGAETMLADRVSIGGEVGVIALRELDDGAIDSIPLQLETPEPFGGVTIYTSKVGVKYHF